MHHFESMPSLHLSSHDDSFPTSPPASPLSFTSTPMIPGKPSRHSHRRSLAISSHLTFTNPALLDQNSALITPPLSSPALSFPKSASFESLRSGPTTLDYDSDLPRTPTVDDISLHAIPSTDTLPRQVEEDEDIILPDAEPDTEIGEYQTLPGEEELPVKLRKVAFNDAIVYYPPRPLSSRHASFSSQMSQPSPMETTPSISSPRLSHRRSLSFLLPSPSFLPSSSSSSVHRHTRERKSWAGLLTSSFTSARRRCSTKSYRPPTPPLGHNLLCNDDEEDGDDDDDDDDLMDPWQPPPPVIDLDAALGPFPNPGSPMSQPQLTKFWSLTSHVGTHRRSESAPEILGLGSDVLAPHNEDSSRPPSRGLKRKMSVIDEEDRHSQPEEMEIDTELHQIMLQEGAEMGEMGDLVVDPVIVVHDTKKLSKRRDWRTSLKDWWRRV
jgi:hypothetical protein